MEDQINSVTNCPICGSVVTVGSGDGESHFYIPMSEEKLAHKIIEEMGFKWEDTESSARRVAQHILTSKVVRDYFKTFKNEIK